MSGSANRQNIVGFIFFSRTVSASSVAPLVRSINFVWIASADKGTKAFESPLEAPPVYHGLVFANGQVFIALDNGQVVCLGAGQ